MTRFSAVLFCIALAAAGCDSGPKMARISGQVLIDGKPLAHGFIRISPAGHRAAMAKLDAEGRFTMSTAPDKDGDGVALGTHRAAVIGLETLGPGTQKWHAPKKYNSEETSNLEVTIDGDNPNLIINLTWDGGKPYIETFGKE